MFKITQRYLASFFIPAFAISLIFFIGFLLTSQLFRITRIVVNKGVNIFEMLILIMHIALSFIPMATPLAALFATVFTLNKLSEDSEIVAMRSFGMTKFKLYSPFLILSLFIAIAVFCANQNLIPYSKTQFKNGLIKLTSTELITDIKAGQFFTEIPNITLFAEKTYNRGNSLEDVFIQLKGKNEKIIFAKKGNLVKEKGAWGIPAVKLKLFDGNIIEVDVKKDSVRKILFKEYELPVLDGNYRPGFVTKASMRNNEDLWKVLKENKKNNIKNSGSKKIELEFWSRFNTPIQCILFIFLGFCCGIKKGRGESRNSGAIALVLLIVYYSLFFAGVGFARKGGLFPPYVAVFTPTLLLAIISVKLYKELDWNS